MAASQVSDISKSENSDLIPSSDVNNHKTQIVMRKLKEYNQKIKIRI